MKLKSLMILSLLVVGIKGFAQSSPDAINEYINQYRSLAIEEEHRTGVPASIKLAQGILETEAGKSDLVLKSNNHFGIKCKTSWTGEKVYHDDDARGECFRKYASAQDSYVDHSDYLKKTERYAFLFKLDPTDYRGWAFGLKQAGYATNPKYPQILIRYIEEYNLNDYTLIALGRKPEGDIMASASPAGQSASKGGNGSPFLEGITISSSSEPVTRNESTLNAETGVEKQVAYPEGEFRINNTRVVYAKTGTSLLAIAEQYDVRYKWVLDFNEIKDGTDQLQNSQLIFLQRKRKQGLNEFHLVETGENLYTISQQEGIRLESLLEYNQLSMDMKPAPGEKLYLQQQSPARPKLAFAH